MFFEAPDLETHFMLLLICLKLRHETAKGHPACATNVNLSVVTVTKRVRQSDVTNLELINQMASWKIMENPSCSLMFFP